MSFDRVWSVAFVDGEPKVIFVGRESGAVQKYSAKTNELLLSFESAHTAAVTGILAPTPDEVTTCSVDTTIRQFVTAAEHEGKREGKVTPCDLSLRCLMPLGAEPGSYLAGTGDGPIVKVENGAALPAASRWVGHTDAVVALAAAEPFVLSASYDQTIRGWDPASGTTVVLFRGHTNQIKGIAVSGQSLFSVGRDDTVLVWNVPTELPQLGGGGGGQTGGEDGTGDGAAAEGADGSPVAEGGTTAPASPSAADDQQQPQGPSYVTISPAGIVELPSTPNAIALGGAGGGGQAFIGCTDHTVKVINTKQLAKGMQSYAAQTESAFLAAKRKLDQICSVKTKNEKRLAKKAIKQFKLKLQDSALAELRAERAAKREAARQAREEGAEGAEEGAEGEEEVPEEIPADDEDDGGQPDVALTEEQQAELAAFTEETNAEAAKKVAAIAAERAAKVAKLSPLRTQMYRHVRDSFVSSPFCGTAVRSNDSVVALACDGQTVFAAAGADVQIVETRLGVLAL